MGQGLCCNPKSETPEGQPTPTPKKSYAEFKDEIPIEETPREKESPKVTVHVTVQNEVKQDERRDQSQVEMEAKKKEEIQKKEAELKRKEQDLRNEEERMKEELRKKEEERRQEEQRRKEEEQRQKEQEERKKQEEEQKKKKEQERKEKETKEKKRKSEIQENCRVWGRPQYEKVWDTKGLLKIAVNCSFWHSPPPSGWSVLGDVVWPGSNWDKNPNLHGRRSLIIRSSLPFQFPAPKDYKCVWHNKNKSVSAWTNKPVSIWEPIPINENFQAIGHVVQNNYEKPSLDRMRTVHKSMLRECKKHECKKVWDKKGTGTKGRLMTIFETPMNLFIAVPLETDEAPTQKLWMMRDYEFMDFGVSWAKGLKLQQEKRHTIHPIVNNNHNSKNPTTTNNIKSKKEEEEMDLEELDTENSKNIESPNRDGSLMIMS